MGLSRLSRYQVRHLLPLVRKCGLDMSKQSDAVTRRVLRAVINDIRRGDAMALRRSKHCSLTASYAITSVKKLPLPASGSFHSSYFMPTEIRSSIEKGSNWLVKYECELQLSHGRTVAVVFNIVSVDKYHGSPAKSEARARSVVLRMLRWLCVAYPHSDKKCGGNLEVYFYDLTCPKSAPTSDAQVLSTSHVNSAYADVCAPHGTITIFRREEWFKVFVHETFHALGLDFATLDQSRFDRGLKSLYRLSIDYAAQEMYAETWARVVNVCYAAYDSAADTAQSIDAAIELLQLERLHAIEQCDRVLAHMGLTYSILSSRDPASVRTRQLAYKQNTNVFSYYVATAVILGEFPRFFAFCREHNTGLFDFEKSTHTMLAFTAMYLDMATDDTVEKVSQCLRSSRGVSGSSMMMGCVDYA